MLTVLLLAISIAGQTKLYSSGCAPIDTPSAVMPIAEFRQVIKNNEERALLQDAFSTCLDQAETLKKQILAWRASDSADSISASKYKAALDTSEKARDTLVRQMPLALNKAYTSGFWDGVKRATIVAAAVDAAVVLVTTVLVITHW